MEADEARARARRAEAQLEALELTVAHLDRREAEALAELRHHQAEASAEREVRAAAAAEALDRCTRLEADLAEARRGAEMALGEARAACEHAAEHAAAESQRVQQLQDELTRELQRTKDVRMQCELDRVVLMEGDRKVAEREDEVRQKERWLSTTTSRMRSATDALEAVVTCMQCCELLFRPSTLVPCGHNVCYKCAGSVSGELVKSCKAIPRTADHFGSLALSALLRPVSGLRSSRDGDRCELYARPSRVQGCLSAASAQLAVGMKPTLVQEIQAHDPSARSAASSSRSLGPCVGDLGEPPEPADPPCRAHSAASKLPLSVRRRRAAGRAPGLQWPSH